MWSWIMTIGGLYYHFNGIVNAHHHPNNLYEGDKPRYLIKVIELVGFNTCN